MHTQVYSDVKWSLVSYADAIPIQSVWFGAQRQFGMYEQKLKKKFVFQESLSPQKYAQHMMTSLDLLYDEVNSPPIAKLVTLKQRAHTFCRCLTRRSPGWLSTSWRYWKLRVCGRSKETLLGAAWYKSNSICIESAPFKFNWLQSTFCRPE